MANADTVYDFLVASGQTPTSAAGIVGNLQGESGDGLNTRASGDGGTSHGIAQWHNDRWTSLVSWANSKGWDPFGLGTQEQYLAKELRDYGLWERLKTVTSPGQAVSIMVREFEKPADPAGAIATRTPKANALLAKDAPTVWDRIKALDPVGAAQTAVGDATSSVGSSIADAVNGPVKDLLTRGAGIFLGVALIGGGIYLAARPKIKELQGASRQAVLAAV